jgi:hypothetical protein
MIVFKNCSNLFLFSKEKENWAKIYCRQVFKLAFLEVIFQGLQPLLHS